MNLEPELNLLVMIDLYGFQELGMAQIDYLTFK